MTWVTHKTLVYLGFLSQGQNLLRSPTFPLTLSRGFGYTLPVRYLLPLSAVFLALALALAVAGCSTLAGLTEDIESIGKVPKRALWKEGK